jgi:hypothetical protein
MPKDRLKKHLEDIADLYGDVLSRMSENDRKMVGIGDDEYKKWKNRGRGRDSKPSSPQANRAGKAPTGVPQEAWDNMTEEQRALF